MPDPTPTPAVLPDARARFAQIAECAFDDRPRSRVGHPSHMDWEDGYREGTQAAAAAIRAATPPASDAAIPAGFVMVPVEPTPQMFEACFLAAAQSPERMWSAMLAAAPKVASDTGAGLRDIARERQRQIEVEGWTPEHDDRHNNRSIATAAACYTMFAAATDEARNTTDLPGSLASLGKPIRGWAAFLQIWPWDRRWWKPTSRRADLVKAGALIIAEIERLDRKEAARG